MDRPEWVEAYHAECERIRNIEGMAWVFRLQDEVSEYFRESEFIRSVEIVATGKVTGTRVSSEDSYDRVMGVGVVFSGYPNGCNYQAYRVVDIYGDRTDLTRDIIVKAIEDAYAEWLESLG